MQQQFINPNQYQGYQQQPQGYMNPQMSQQQMQMQQMQMQQQMHPQMQQPMYNGAPQQPMYNNPYQQQPRQAQPRVPAPDRFPQPRGWGPGRQYYPEGVDNQPMDKVYVDTSGCGNYNVNRPQSGAPRADAYKCAAGVSYDELRQALAEHINKTCHDVHDPVSYHLWSLCSGSGNWLTAKMDSMTRTAGYLLDYENLINHQTVTNQLINKVMSTVTNCSKAVEFKQHPEFYSIVSPTANKHYSDWEEYSRRLSDTLQNSGVVDGSVSPQMTRPVQQPMNPAYGQPQQPQMGYGNQYQQPQQSFGGMSQQQMYSGVQGGMMNNQSHGPLRPENNLQRTNTSSSYLSEQESLDEFRAPPGYTGPVDKYGFPIKNEEQETMNNQQFKAPAQPHQVREPVREPTLAEQGVYTLDDIIDGTMPWPDETKEVVKEEPTDPRFIGLLDDEAMVITKNEAKDLVRIYGSQVIERPYTGLITASPFTSHLHYVLLKNDKIRQIHTHLGEPMRLDAHLDILKPMRESVKSKYDPNRGKTYTSAVVGAEFPFDRFAASKVVLAENLEKIKEDDTAAEKELKAVEAFEKYNAEIEKDLEKDYTGESKFFSDPDNEGEEFNEHVKPETQDKLKAHREKSLELSWENMEDENEHDSPLIEASSIYDVKNKILTADLGSTSPVVEDKWRLQRFEKTSVLKVFNHPDDREEVAKVLAPFFTNVNGKPTWDENKSTLAIYRNVLRKNSAIIPSDLWNKLNNTLTEALNNGIKYILGFDGVWVDSFTDDLDEFQSWYLSLDLKQYPNLAIAYEFLAQNVTLAAKTLLNVKDEEDVATECYFDSYGINHTSMRAIVSHKNFTNIYIPEVMNSLGFNITDKEVTISREDHNHLFGQLANIAWTSFLVNEKELTQAATDAKQALYITTADDVHYRVYPKVGTRSEEFDIQNHNTQDICDEIVLVQLPALV